MKICFPVLVSFFVFLCMFSFFVSAESTEPESYSFTETSSEISIEETSESSTTSGVSDEQAMIINRLDLIYTLGLFFVAFLAALLVIFILWRVLDVFI